MANNNRDDKELERLRQLKAPWEITNELFEQYGFDYKLATPPNRNVEFTIIEIMLLKGV